MAKQELIAYERKEASSQQQKKKMTDNFAFTMSTLDSLYMHKCIKNFEFWR